VPQVPQRDGSIFKDPETLFETPISPYPFVPRGLTGFSRASVPGAIGTFVLLHMALPFRARASKRGTNISLKMVPMSDVPRVPLRYHPGALARQHGAAGRGKLPAHASAPINQSI